MRKEGRRISVGGAGVLLLVSCAAFLQLLRGEFVFDDDLYLAANPDLARVHSLGDCLSFQLEPTRPITNLSIALVHFWAPKSVVAQRMASLVIHLLVVFLAYVNLHLLLKRMHSFLPEYFPLGVSLLFAIHPIHSETLGVAKFRGEILASLFTLFAAWISQRLSRSLPSHRHRIFLGAVLFISIGGAALSKEPFLLVAAVTCLCFFYLVPHETLRARARIISHLGHRILGSSLNDPHSQNPRHIDGYASDFAQSARPNLTPSCAPKCEIILARAPSALPCRGLGFLAGMLITGIFWAGVMWILLQSEVPTQYDYQDHIGKGVFSMPEHLRLAARALLEGISKLALGVGLTVHRLQTRGGMGESLGVIPSSLVLLSFVLCLAILAVQRGWLRVWSIVLGVSAGVYLMIPNLNIGSERYWYFSVLGFVSLGAYLVIQSYKKMVSSVTRLFLFSLVGYGAVLGLVLQTRLLDYRSSQTFYEAELASHPELPKAWINMAEIVMSTRPGEALPYLLKARTLSRNEVLFIPADIRYFYLTRQLERLEKKVGQSNDHFFSNRTRAGFYEYSAILNFDKGRCKKAHETFLAALKYDPGNFFLRQDYEKFLVLKNKKEDCW